MYLWQQVNQARQNVRDGPKLLEEYRKQLETMVTTARLVEAEKELQTAEIGEQLVRVEEISRELHDFLESLGRSQEKSKVQKYLRAIGTGEQNAQELRRILDRWAGARADLSLRIQLAQVGLSRSLHGGVVAVVPTIQRIDQSLQRLLNKRLTFAVQLEQLEPMLASQRGVCLTHLALLNGRTNNLADDHTILLNDDAQETLGINADNLTIQDNSTFEDAVQHNSISGTEDSHVFITAAISRNVAKGYSKQRNSIGDPREFERLYNSEDG